MNHFKQNTEGRSLVEVLIALTIGMALLIGITSTFLANKQIFRVTDDKSRLDEEGRLALSLMAFHVRMAGYGTLLSASESFTNETAGNIVTPATNTNFADKSGVAMNAIRGCANGFSDTGVDVSVLTCAAGTTSDAFLVRYVVDQRTVTANGALATDCLGANVVLSPAIPPFGKNKGSAAFYLIENRFYTQINAVTGVPELYCRGNGGTPPGTNFTAAGQPIAENVEQMKITYGLSDKPVVQAKTPVEQFVTVYATASTMLPAVIVAGEMVPGDWERVISARICLVVRSANDNVVTTPQTYRDCNDNSVVATDHRLRGVFSSTVTIRNRSVGTTS